MPCSDETDRSPTSPLLTVYLVNVNVHATKKKKGSRHGAVRVLYNPVFPSLNAHGKTGKTQATHIHTTLSIAAIETAYLHETHEKKQRRGGVILSQTRL